MYLYLDASDAIYSSTFLQFAGQNNGETASNKHA